METKDLEYRIGQMREDFMDKLSKKADTSYVEKLEVILDSKVGTQTFFWVFGIAMTIIISLFSYTAFRLDKLSDTTIDIKTDVSFIQGKFVGKDVIEE